LREQISVDKEKDCQLISVLGKGQRKNAA
jgi:hypothetical protein